MVHIKKCLFFNVFSIYGVQKTAYFRCGQSNHIIGYCFAISESAGINGANKAM